MTADDEGAGGDPPNGPTAAVIAVLALGETVLLVRRGRPPNCGAWGFPGGKIRPGEPHADAAVRELYEETGVAAEPDGVVDAADVIDGSAHYVLVAVRMRYRSGTATAGDDAAEAAWFPLHRLPSPLLPDVERLAAAALGSDR